MEMFASRRDFIPPQTMSCEKKKKSSYEGRFKQKKTAIYLIGENPDFPQGGIHSPEDL